MLTLGAATVERVIDLDPFALPLGLLFPGAEIEAIRDAEPWLAPHHVDFAAGNVLLGVQSHLLRVGGLTILIDACVGEHKPRPRRADWHDRAATGYLARLAASGVRAIFCGDAIHSPAQLRRPDWCSAFCADREQAVATRIALLEDAHADGALILPAHLRGPLALRAAPAGEAGWRPDFV
ncbi:hypothetical protein SAMN05444336_102601 [Albimonas donghaensis]|uniref:Metallo-beta-lactamase superfamily protein n=1 Tax=Albimonas donghaensis TaxID=356660 RepID=A0A1H2X4A3_9RHOB|nr:hypothetical protein [Albimonas donghaensis]SDW87720.1 hypothetical protein SAMN05444336_102601 [Albimonas donghaensis]